MEFVIVALVGLAIAGLVVFFVRRAMKGVVGPSVEDVKRALEIVWYGVYKMESSPPRLDWVTGSRLNCHNATGWLLSDGTCAAGNSQKDQDVCAIAWVPGEKLSDTAFSHELRHAVGWRTMTPTDHNSAEFQIAVDVANLHLRAAGL